MRRLAIVYGGSAKVTLATTCMGRAQHIAQTLPFNLAANEYRDTEFLLLDYNSPDGLEAWIREHLIDHLGVEINFFAERSKKFFLMSHAKNVAAALAQGDIVVNVDADRFIDPGLVAEVLDKVNGPGVIGRGVVKGDPMDWSACGLIALWKQDLASLGGYDERMVNGWGAEDHDLIIRAKALGYRVVTIEQCGHSLPHPVEDRNCLTASRLDHETSARLNGALHVEAMRARKYIANCEIAAGEAIVIRNFSERIKTRLTLRRTCQTLQPQPE